ncbi:hypothetical protein DID88_007580 [Monilinia fructigena]|uniref:Uncharacterized protein n=1 Tax=Monilinia fructigena TaxID=38457 RepID=A0A395J2Q4_9HELO|nr:hypothetical protein DID88_007580 [Monilinia fructigena]
MLGWVKDKVNGLKNRKNRSAGGAYEEPLNSNVRGRAANRGFGPLDPDDAWDARVGTEADAYGPGGYYEEQELGLHGGHPGISATPGPPELSSPPRGRSLSRGEEPYVGGSKAGLDRRYDEEMGTQPANNPFNDPAELRGVSPRPMDSNTKAHRLQDDNHSERSQCLERTCRGVNITIHRWRYGFDGLMDLRFSWAGLGWAVLA